MSQTAAVNSLGVQPFPLVMYSFKPLPSSSLSLLDGLCQVYHVVYHSSSSLEYGDPCLFSCTYILGHALGMEAFTFLLYVLVLCMMYVYIYLFTPFQCDCYSACHLRQAMPNFHRKSKVTCHRIFAVEIWYFVECLRKAQIGTKPNQKPNLKTSMHAKPQKPMPKSYFYCQSSKIKVLSKQRTILGQALQGA